MDIIMEDMVEWFKRRKPSELIAMVGVTAVLLILAIIALRHNSTATTATGITCGNFTSLTKDEQANTVHQLPGYMDMLPVGLSSTAARIVGHCRSYPSNTLITDRNILY